MVQWIAEYWFALTFTGLVIVYSWRVLGPRSWMNEEDPWSSEEAQGDTKAHAHSAALRMRDDASRQY